MNATGWGEWKKRRKGALKQIQVDPEIRLLKLASRAESMRKLRAHRRRMHDIWLVYKSDMYPRHFRRTIRTDAIRELDHPRNFYPIWKLLRASGISRP